MKRFLILPLLMSLGMATYHSAQAQIEDIMSSKDSSLMVNAVYVGALSTTGFSIDSINANTSIGICVGGMATWKITKTLNINSFVVLQSSFSKTGETHTIDALGISKFELKFTPNKHWRVQLGNIPTLSTEQRPLPHTSTGQFETWTESNIPGIAPGVKAAYAFGSGTHHGEFGAGVAMRHGAPEFHGKFAAGPFTVSGYYSTRDSSYGNAVTYKSKRVYDVFVYKQNNILANVLVFNITDALAAYADMGYSFASKTLVRGEWGVTKGFQTGKNVSGLFGLGYCQELRMVKDIFFIHI